jgi:hypothetical protein
MDTPGTDTCRLQPFESSTLTAGRLSVKFPKVDAQTDLSRL